MTSVDRKFVERLSEFLAKLKDADIEAIAAGDARFELVVVQSANEAPAKRRRPDEQELRELLQELHSADSREEGESLLEIAGLTKVGLEALARLADLPVQRRDKVADLRQRLIEATIGYRLRSNAIKGTAE